jgi:hypothetical protein
LLFPWATTADSSDFLGSGLVGLEFGHFGEAASQTLQHLLMERHGRGGKRVIFPLSCIAHGNQARLSEIGEVARGAGLLDAEDGHQVAHAALSTLKKVEDAQPGPVAERPENEVQRGRIRGGVLHRRADSWNVRLL